LTGAIKIPAKTTISIPNVKNFFGIYFSL